MGVGILSAIKALWLMLSGGAYLAGAWLIWESLNRFNTAHLTHQGGIMKALGAMGGGVLLIAAPTLFHGTTVQIFGSGGGDMFSAAGSGASAGAELAAAVFGFLQLVCGGAVLYGAWSLHLCGEEKGVGWKAFFLITIGTLGVNYKLTVAGLAQLFGATNPLTYFGLA
jgi:hypothetical protein